jgi:hypothetical protein
VKVSELDGKYLARGMLYKSGLLNRPELNKVLLSLIYSWVEGRGKDREFRSLFILEDCIFLLEFYPSL